MCSALDDYTCQTQWHNAGHHHVVLPVVETVEVYYTQLYDDTHIQILVVVRFLSYICMGISNNDTMNTVQSPA